MCVCARVHVCARMYNNGAGLCTPPCLSTPIHQRGNSTGLARPLGNEGCSAQCLAHSRAAGPLSGNKAHVTPCAPEAACGMPRRVAAAAALPSGTGRGSRCRALCSRDPRGVSLPRGICLSAFGCLKFPCVCVCMCVHTHTPCRHVIIHTCDTWDYLHLLTRTRLAQLLIRAPGLRQVDPWG